MKLALALFAIAPLALGPLPVGERTLTMNLCGGGEITIPLDDGGDRQAPDIRHKGCHAGTCRNKVKRPRSR